MNSDNLKYVLQEFVGRPLPASRPRELVLPVDSGKVIGLAGVRRCGKTCLFFDTIRRLQARNVDRRRKEWLYHANGSEVDLCDADGTEYLNVCWQLADPDTARRESVTQAKDGIHEAEC